MKKYILDDCMELNKIYNEDCMKTMARMKDNFIDLVVTSPPYDDMRTYKNNVGLKWSDKIWKPIIKELFRVVNVGGVVVWIVGDKTENGSETGTSFRQALFAKECGFNLHDTMIWAKMSPYPASGKRYQQTFEYMFIFSKGKPNVCNFIKHMKSDKTLKRWQNSKAVSKTEIIKTKNGDIRKKWNKNQQKRFLKSVNNIEKIAANIWYEPVGNKINSKDSVIWGHPATFPENLAANHILSWSNENDLIYDCFAGSGTTFKMSHLLKRRFIGSEISAEYCELANKRVKPYLSQIRMF